MSILRPRGLPIGNLTSQIFANYYLTPLDRFIKEELQVRHFLRYMDDALLFGSNKKLLFELKSQIDEFLIRLRLKLHQNKTQIFPTKNGVKFLGFHLYPGYRRIHPDNLKRFKRQFKQRIYQYENGERTFENLLLSLNGWLGFADKNRHTKLINTILKSLHVNHQEKGYSFTFCVNKFY